MAVVLPLMIFFISDIARLSKNIYFSKIIISLLTLLYNITRFQKNLLLFCGFAQKSVFTKQKSRYKMQRLFYVIN